MIRNRKAIGIADGRKAAGKESVLMKVWKLKIRFNDGAYLERAEWGKTKKEALKTLRSIYGNTFVVIA